MLQNVNVHHENKKLNRNVYNTVRSLFYFEILDFESKLLQIKAELHTEFFFLSGIRWVKQSKSDQYHKVKLCFGPEGHCDIMFCSL